MNVQGPSSPYPRVVSTPTAARTPASPTAPDPAGTAAVPVAGGTSPAGEATFWDLLTPEEREFFAEQTALGPLTYGPRRPREAAGPGPLGQRVDVRG